MDFHRVKDEQGIEEVDELDTGGEEEQEAYPPFKNPSFLRTMRKSHVINGMPIPRKFYNEFKKKIDRGIILQQSSQSTAWDIGVSYRSAGPSGSYFLASGWKSFVADNEIEVGDIVVFRLIKQNIFSFEIYGAKDGFEKINTPVSAAAEGQKYNSSQEDDESDEDYSMGRGKGKTLMHKKKHRKRDGSERFLDEESTDSEDESKDDLEEESEDDSEEPPNPSARVLVSNSSRLFIRAPYHSWFPRSSMRIFFIDCNKKKWPVNWHSNARALAGGFTAFVHHHCVRIGDSLRVDPQSKHHFRVTVSRAAVNAKVELSSSSSI